MAHLGMSGQFKIQRSGSPYEAHLRANFELSNGKEMRFVDQRTFGWLCVDQLTDGVPKIVSHIAIDLFDPNFNKRAVVAEISKKRGQIKKIILDQEVLSGIGNIYADEALWYCAINPLTSCAKLSKTQIRNVITASKKVMAAALKSGGTSFDDLYKNVNGQSGYFERSLKAYGRDGEPCKRCGKAMKRIVISNRSAHYCPKCQQIGRAHV